MATENKDESTTASPPAANDLDSGNPDVPYSIFDKRQKAVIVLIVSIAATCKSIAAMP